MSKICAILVILLVACRGDAPGQRQNAFSGPLTGGGALTGVTAGTGLSGGGTTGNVTVGLANTAVTAGSYTSANITVDAQGRITAASNGTGGGGGITNNAPANTLMMSDGTNAVSSDVTDASSIVKVATHKLQFGSTVPGSGQQAWFSLQSPTTTTQLFMDETDTNHTAYEAINIVGFQQATFDTTAAPATAMGGDFEVTSTRVAGANQLTNIGVIVSASGGDINYALKATAGTIRADDGASFGPVVLSGLSLGGTATAGVVNLTGAGANTISWSNSSSAITAGQITSSSTFSANSNAFLKGEVRLDSGAVDFYMYPTTALSASTQRNIYLSAGGTNGVVRINANTGGIAHTGTGGLEVWPGNNGGAAVGGTTGGGLTWGTTVATGGLTGPKWSSGTGAPASSCAVGDIYSRTDGGPLATVYTCIATNTWTPMAVTTPTVAAGHVDSGTGLFTKQEGFAGNPVKNGTGDWTLTYSAAFNSDQGVVLAQVQDQGGAATRMNITVQSVDTTHVRVRTFSNGTASDQHFWIKVMSLN